MKFKRMISLLLLCCCVCSALAPVAASEEQNSEPTEYIFYMQDGVDVSMAEKLDAEPVPYAEGYYVASSAKKLQPYLDKGLVEDCWEDGELQLLSLDYSSDPHLSEQWYLDAIDAAAFRSAGLDGSGIKVALIDSGVYTEHEDLNAGAIVWHNVLNDGAGLGTDSVGHGTMVAGILAAQIDNEIGIAGLTDKVSLLAVRCFSNSSGTVSDALSAIGYAIEQGVDVINLSIGGTSSVCQALEPILKQAADQGVLIVAAVGNRGDGTLFYPAAFDRVIGVGAVDSDGTVCSFSQHNSSVDITAPGNGIYGLGIESTDSYKTLKGTSFAAPMVSALAVAAKQADRKIDHDGFIKLLKACAADKGTVGRDDYYGEGVVNVSDFVKALQADYAISYETNGGAITQENYSVFYKIGSGSSAVLPLELTRASYLFSGWYLDEECSGNALTEIPAGSVGDITLYAGWTQSEIDYTVSGVTVCGAAAVLNAEMNILEVTLPYETDLTELAGSDIQVSFADSRAEVTDISGDGADWSFAAGETTHIISIRSASAPVPTVAFGSEAQSGEASPASFDALTPEISYEADVSGWFENALSYHAELLYGAGTLALEGSILSYTPSAVDAGKTISIRVAAENTEGAAASDVMVSVEVSAVPPSSAVVLAQTVSYDLSMETDGCTVEIRPFDNAVVSVGIDGNELPPEVYNLSGRTELQESVQQCVISHWVLYGLTIGAHTLQFQFSDGRTNEEKSITLPLTIEKTHLVRFYNESVLVSSSRVPHGTALLLPTAPMKTGHTFLGWYSDESGGEKLQSGTEVIQDIAGYARWQNEENPGGSFGGGSGGGFGGNTGGLILPPGPKQPDIVINPDGSVTTIEIDSNTGTVTKTTERPDGTASMLVENEFGSVMLPPDAMSTILEKEGADNITVEITSFQLEELSGVLLSEELTDGMAIEVDFEANGCSIHRFGGAEIILDLPAGKNHMIGGCYEIIALSDDGKRSVLVGECIVVNGKLVIRIKITRTSVFVVTDKAVKTFDDVAKEAYYHDAVLWAAANDVTQGTSDDAFSPEVSCIRGQVVTFLWRVAGSPKITANNSFTDVDADAYYYDAVLWARENGITLGTSANTFSPDDTVTRAQFVMFLYRYAGEPLITSEMKFTDVNVDSYYVTAVMWAAANGVTQGTGAATFSPLDICTRGQIVSFLYRYSSI